MFIDSDIGFDPQDVLALAAIADPDSDKDIVCGPYPKKTISWEKIKRAVDRGFADENPNKLEKYVGDYVFNPVEGVTEIKVNEPAEVLVPAGLVVACLAAPKHYHVPGFLHRGKQIEELDYAVVEAYGTDIKVGGNYETGNWIKAVMIEKPKKGKATIVGQAHPELGIEKSFCISCSEYALRFPQSPLLIARAMVGEGRGQALAEAYLKINVDVFVGEAYLGWAFPQNVAGPHRPSPNGGSRAGAHVLAAAAAFLPPTNQFARPREFDDLKIMAACGGGEWHTRIVATYAFVWLVLVARWSGIPVAVPTTKREKFLPPRDEWRMLWPQLWQSTTSLLKA